jgi:hypothetical protein
MLHAADEDPTGLLGAYGSQDSEPGNDDGPSPASGNAEGEAGGMMPEAGARKVHKLCTCVAV